MSVRPEDGDYNRQGLHSSGASPASAVLHDCTICICTLKIALESEFQSRRIFVSEMWASARRAGNQPSGYQTTALLRSPPGSSARCRRKSCCTWDHTGPGPAMIICWRCRGAPDMGLPQVMLPAVVHRKVVNSSTSRPASSLAALIYLFASQNCSCATVQQEQDAFPAAHTGVDRDVNCFRTRT